jgi:hypothetical protein
VFGVRPVKLALVAVVAPAALQAGAVGPTPMATRYSLTPAPSGSLTASQESATVDWVDEGVTPVGFAGALPSAQLDVPLPA